MIYMSFFIGLILICKGGDWFVDASNYQKHGTTNI